MEAFDVVICGGGLAGQTLARQLRMSDADLRIAVLEKMHSSDIRDAAHKVGESSVEVGAHYFLERLGLKPYMVENQLPKFGLRFYFENEGGPIEDRMELGARQFPRFPSAQLDRGVLERDLRAMNRRTGIELIEGAKVDDIKLAEGEDDHEIHYTCAGQSQVLRSRWVADASGRRRLLQSKLGLSRDNGHKVSAAWWRLEGKHDVTTSIDPAHSWHREVKEARWFSTDHFMGRGYWVWLIPLSSGSTSVGIVTDETIHPIATYNDFGKATAWLERHEPHIARLLAGHEPIDFLVLKNYSYHSAQIFSHRRWTCVGEAGMFLDPFYSPGSDFIAYTNSITTKMVSLDLAGKLDEATVAKFNRFVLDDVAQNFLEIYRGQYAVFGSRYVMATKVTWDTCFYWAFPGQMFFRNLLIDPDTLDEFHELAAQFLVLNHRVQQIFRTWADHARQPSRRFYIEYGAMPFFRGLHFDLGTEKTAEKCFVDMRKNLQQFEEWAQVIFEHALADVSPDRIEQLPKPLWVNPYGVGLDADRWLADGLFRVSAPSRPLDNFAAQMRTTLVPPGIRG